MLQVALLIAVAAQHMPGPPPTVSLATSEAIDIARVAARSWENGRAESKRSSFDVVDPIRDQLEGYTSVIYYLDNQPILDISINLATGQVVDRNRCIYFDGNFFKNLRKRFSVLTGASPLPPVSLATALGCDTLATKKGLM